MRKVAKERAIRLSKRLANFSAYLRDEAGEYFYAEQIIKYGGMIGASFIRMEPPVSRQEKIHHLYIAAEGCVKSSHILDLVYKDGYLEDRTYVSLKRECMDLLAIMISKGSKLMDDLGTEMKF